MRQYFMLGTRGLFTFLFFILFLLQTANHLLGQTDTSLCITVSTVNGYPQIELENSIFRAAIKKNTGGAAGIEHVIKDLFIKSNGTDIVVQYLDACTQRGPCTTAVITNNSPEEKTVRLTYFYSDAYGSYTGITDYTIFANSPIIKIDYVQYNYSGGWANTVDYSNLGGGSFAIYGQAGYGPLVYYPNVFWDSKNGDPVDGGALNYRNHMIMAFGYTGPSGYGFGRVMPIYQGILLDGGIRILKLLGGKGFETFPSAAQGWRPAFTGYLFVFDTGIENVISFGQDIVDAQVDQTPLPLPVELTSFGASVVSRSVNLTWETASEINNYGFEIERQKLGLENHFSEWEVIGFVNGAGNSNAIKKYNFIDKNISSGCYSYRLKQIDHNGQFEYSSTVSVAIESPTEYDLSQNFPNPFNPSTKIEIMIAVESEVNLAVYNLLGEKISVLMDEIKQAGQYQVELDASDLASGTYLYVLSGNKLNGGKEFRLVKKMTVLK